MINVDDPGRDVRREAGVDSTQDNAPSESRPRPRRASRRLTVAIALVVAVAGGIAVWWGQPRLGDGGLVGTGAGMTWANDGIDNTRMIVRGRSVATVSATFSISNDGHLPFTVHGLDVTDMGDWLARQEVTFVPGLPGMDDNAPLPAREVTLRPGTQATVLWSLDLACQPPLSSGGSMSIVALRFRVSLLGIPTTRELPLERPITFVGDPAVDRVPSTDCAID
jgi:hypothetical protein